MLKVQGTTSIVRKCQTHADILPGQQHCRVVCPPFCRLSSTEQCRRDYRQVLIGATAFCPCCLPTFCCCCLQVQEPMPAGGSASADAADGGEASVDTALAQVWEALQPYIHSMPTCALESCVTRHGATPKATQQTL